MTTTKVSIPHSALAGAATPAPATRPPPCATLFMTVLAILSILQPPATLPPLPFLPAWKYFGATINKFCILWEMCSFPHHLQQNSILYFGQQATPQSRYFPPLDWQSRQWSPVSSSRARVLIYQHSCIRAQQAPS